MNRAYYAAFAVAHWKALRLGEKPRSREGTWSHEVLPTVLESTMRRVGSPSQARHVAQIVRRLRAQREVADYRPGFVLDRADALGALKDAELVIRMVGALDERE